MGKLRIFVLTILLSCQLSVVAAVEQFTIASNEVHQNFSHDQVIDHHHHDAFAVHFDKNSSNSDHQHTTDNFQNSALLTHFELLTINLAKNVHVTFNPQEPSSTVLDGLLRPPQLLA
jgi:uncharacterized surface anchored protein